MVRCATTAVSATMWCRQAGQTKASTKCNNLHTTTLLATTTSQSSSALTDVSVPSIVHQLGLDSDKLVYGKHHRPSLVGLHCLGNPLCEIRHTCLEPLFNDIP